LKKVGTISEFIKKFKGFLVILVFSGISQDCFFIGKVMDWVYGSRDHDWLSVHGGLTTMGRVRPLRGLRGRRDRSERERRSSGFSPITPLGGGAVEMAT
jgi:hypothetical protein